MTTTFRSLGIQFIQLCAVGFLVAPCCTSAQIPEWIWHPNQGGSPTNGEVRFFRTTFAVEGRVAKAILSVAADNRAEVRVNQQPPTIAHGFDRATRADVTSELRPGRNVLAIRAKNDTDVAGLLVRLEIKFADHSLMTVVSGDSWLTSALEEENWASPDFSTSTNWVRAVSLGKVGVAPWGDSLKSVEATAASTLTVPPGFQVELLRSAETSEGSWICMTVDSRGRLIISPQDNRHPLLRVTLTQRGRVAKTETIPAPIRQAMGLCHANDSLYANAHGPEGNGLYRLVDANHNDRYDTNEVRLLKKFAGEGEHSYHAVVKGPEGMIYVMNGNYTKVPQDISPRSPHRNYQEDFLLTRLWDAGGHAVGLLAPGGHILRTDAEGRHWELLLAGFRNSYDFDFNPDGEMFTFDSDMEWDWGLPWYRPTRILHCVTGGEYGWRSGTSNEPEYYADTLPATVNVGIGSPTGVKFGTKSKFPKHYRGALFAMDWSYGRILAVHLNPQGATYTGSYEAFLQGKPLNVTDLEFGKDGAMYFITGGRGTQSGLYRVRYTGKSPQAATLQKSGVLTSRETNRQASKARTMRRKLESFHGRTDPRAIEVAWPHLGSPDRFLRYAARIALEWQDVGLWKDRALSETNSQAGLTALMALARCGARETQPELLLALKKFPFNSLTEEQELEKLRLIQLSFIRQGRPSPELAALALTKLNRIYPSPSERVNRELVQLLIYLNAPDVIAKTLDLVAAASTQEEEIHYLFHLRNVRNGWTLDQRRRYFEWFPKLKTEGKKEISFHGGAAYNVWTDQTSASRRHPPELFNWFKEAGRDYGDGSSYGKYLVNIRKDAIATLTSAERAELKSVFEENIDTPPWKPVKARHFVKEWTLADLEPQLTAVDSGRDFESGRAAFNDAQCIACHRFGNVGGANGPELTAVASKYSRRDILESMLDPSKVVSDQFQNSIIVKKDGDDVSGRIIDENSERLLVLPNMLAPEATVEVPLGEIATRRVSSVSPMPNGLLNSLTAGEILDLLAYIEAAGKPTADQFRKPETAKPTTETSGARP